MDFPKQIKAIRMGLSIIYLKGSQVGILPIMMYFCPWACFYLVTNSENLDEMQHYAAFHLGLHSLSKYPFMGFQNTKG